MLIYVRCHILSPTENRWVKHGPIGRVSAPNSCLQSRQLKECVVCLDGPGLHLAQSGAFLMKMLRIVSAASGEEVAALAVSELPAEDGAPTIVSLKRYLAKEHFQKRYSRFQLRLLREGDPKFLEDSEILAPPLDLQLVLMNHLPQEEDRGKRFRDKCVAGDLEEVERNLQDLQNPDVDPEDSWIDSPLVLAALNGHTGVVRLLLEATASIEWQHPEDNAMRALHYAALKGHLEVVRVLLEFGADKDARDSLGMTPSQLAAAAGHVPVVGFLDD